MLLPSHLSKAIRSFKMVDQRQLLIVCVLFLLGMFALNAMLSTQQPLAHAGSGSPVSTGDTADQMPNPHSDLIFRATGAKSCEDCHGITNSGALVPRPFENELVTTLRGRAKGVHGPGRFADCLRCHAGGSKGVEKY